MDITRIALTRRRVTAVLIAALILGGFGAYRTMPRQMDPGFIVRTAQVVTLFPGASPERVELLVTDKLEKAIQEIPELDYVGSTSRTGQSVINVNISEKYKDMQPIWDRLRRKVDRIRPDLPDGIIGPDVNDEFGDVFNMIVAVRGDGFTYRELKDVADEVRDAILRVPDVAKAEIIGAQTERVFIEYQDARLARLGLTPNTLRNALEARNIVMPGGSVDAPGERLALEPSGDFASLDALRAALISVPGRPEPVVLSDVADVRRGYVNPATSKVRSQGRDALALAISMRDGGNLIELGQRISNVLAELPGRYPYGVDFDVAFFEPNTVDAKVSDFVSNVVQAVLVVMVVMLLSLGLRTGLAVSALIPTAMIISLLIMSALDIGMDQVSLAALIIALGLLVDNAIVMSESIMVRLEAGQDAVRAAIASASELRIPLLTASLTTAAAFLPIYLAESTVGEYTAPLFKVVTITLLVSWALALTMTPLLCVLVLRVRRRTDDSFDGGFYRGYRSALRVVLRGRWLSLALVLAVFAGSLSLFSYVPKVFFPREDRAFFLADFELPMATPIEDTEAMVTRIDAFIASELAGHDGSVTGWTTFVGGTPPRFVLGYTPEPPESQRAVYMINCADSEVVVDTMRRLSDWVVSHEPAVRPHVRMLASGPPVKKPVQIRLSSPDTERLFAMVAAVKAKLSATAGVKNMDDDWGLKTKKLLVKTNAKQADAAGITHRDVAVSLQTFLSGLQVSEYREGDEVIPVTMQAQEAQRKDLSRLDTLAVFSQTTGRSVPLSQVARLDYAFEPSMVLRRDRYRTVTVESDLAPGTTAAEVIAGVRPWLEQKRASWPLSDRYEIGGEIESSGKANASINAQLPVAGLLIVLLLVFQFDSLRRPLIVLTTIPLALIGVVIGLLVMRSYFGFMTLLGVVSLAGIVINNAIVLIDRIEIEKSENGLSPAQAIIEAAQRRFRPIMLTTATTIASLIPLYLGGGPMFEPMAVAIMFGLIFSTVLTLGFVPLLYSLLFRVRLA